MITFKIFTPFSSVKHWLQRSQFSWMNVSIYIKSPNRIPVKTTMKRSFQCSTIRCKEKPRDLLTRCHLTIEDTRRGIFSYEALRSRLISGSPFPVQSRIYCPLSFISRGLMITRFSPLAKAPPFHSAYYGYQPNVSDEMISKNSSRRMAR